MDDDNEKRVTDPLVNALVTPTLWHAICADRLVFGQVAACAFEHGSPVRLTHAGFEFERLLTYGDASRLKEALDRAADRAFELRSALEDVAKGSAR